MTFEIGDDKGLTTAGRGGGRGGRDDFRDNVEMVVVVVAVELGLIDIGGSGLARMGDVEF
jgi:hypothetical protein